MKEHIESIKISVFARLSEKRWLHTLGVADTAVRIGEYLLPDMTDELEVAALLHDVAKEIPLEEQIRVADEYGILLTDEDMSTPAAIHSFSGVGIIKRDFPAVASENVLSAVKNHTLGSPDMSVFDKIIYLSDYIEPGRKNDSCRRVREYLFSAMSSESAEERLKALDRAVMMAIDNTCAYVLSQGGHVNSRTLLAKASLIT